MQSIIGRGEQHLHVFLVVLLHEDSCTKCEGKARGRISNKFIAFERQEEEKSETCMISITNEFGDVRSC